MMDTYLGNVLLPDLRQNSHSASDSPKSLLIFQKDLKILPPTKLGARGSFMIITGMTFLLLSLKTTYVECFTGLLEVRDPLVACD